jgi:hypothetical protein
MRQRLCGIIAFASLLTWTAGACDTAGVSYVYMAIDSAGAQHRQVFYTDSNGIYCIAKFSSGRTDATLDFTVRQTHTYPWCGALNNPTGNGPVAHPIFGVGEQTPGKGVETAVAEELLPNGIQFDITCPPPPSGLCVPNLPSTGFCDVSKVQKEQAGTCPTSSVGEGPDSCGPGFTCCESLVETVGGSGGSSSPVSDAPYPAGSYVCEVDLDGVEVGETEFQIEYPPGVAPAICPEAPPISGIPCYNWVPEGAQCPGFNASETCGCGVSGIWNCCDITTYKASTKCPSGESYACPSAGGSWACITNP